MATEYEKRYLLFNAPPVKGVDPIIIKQGYLSTNPAKAVRIRMTPQVSELTIKGLRIAGEAPEFNYPVLRDEAEHLMAMCGDDALTKDRYKIPGHDTKIWELDIFTGRHKGLVIAELEMNKGDTFLKPVWLNGAIDITEDNRFSNVVLATTPMAIINGWIAEYRSLGQKVILTP